MRLLLADLSGVVVPPVPPVPSEEGGAVGSVLDDEAMAAVYAAPTGSGPWVRANFATSLDGAVTGSDGRSGSVNSAADHVVFELLRALSDVVVVGAGTLRSEGYGPLRVATRWQPRRLALGLADDLPLVAVTNTGDVPPRLLDAPSGGVLLATHAAAPGLAAAKDALDDDHVLVCGEESVDARRLIEQLIERGLTRILTEGGPHLLGTMLAAGVVDEVCLSITPVVVGGDGPRITGGAALDGAYAPRVLVEQDGTVMGRWTRATVGSEP